MTIWLLLPSFEATRSVGGDILSVDVIYWPLSMVLHHFSVGRIKSKCVMLFSALWSEKQPIHVHRYALVHDITQFTGCLCAAELATWIVGPDVTFLVVAK